MLLLRRFRTLIKRETQTLTFALSTSSYRELSSSLLFNESCVNGQWTNKGEHGTFDVYNPSNGAHIGTVPNMGVSNAQDAIKSAKNAFYEWRFTTAKHRSDILKKWHRKLNENRDEFIKLIVLENGKTLADATSEFDYANSFIEWYAEEARRVYGDIVPSPSASRRMLVINQPRGVAALITPWNFPLAMFTRKAGAALAAGCTVVSKPAEDTPYSIIAAAKLGEEAGLPAGVLNIVTCAHSHIAEVGATLCQSEDVAVVSFTGSTNIGKLIMKQAADTIKHVSLELGGNSPFIVFESADLEKAAAGFIASKFRCTGQTCVCANRLLVQDSIHDKFVKVLHNAMANLRVGDGFEQQTTQGPLINQQAVNKVHSIVEDALSKGAKPIIGGQHHAKGGNFYELTLLQDTNLDMLCMQEEIFGPVSGIFKFSTEDEAIRIANMTESGLASYFYSQDYAQIWRVSERLENGMVGVNCGVVSAVEGLFSGWKQSGIGMESGKWGIDEYLHKKYIAMDGLT